MSSLNPQQRRVLDALARAGEWSDTAKVHARCRTREDILAMRDADISPRAVANSLNALQRRGLVTSRFLADLSVTKWSLTPSGESCRLAASSTEQETP